MSSKTYHSCRHQLPIATDQQYSREVMLGGLCEPNGHSPQHPHRYQKSEFEVPTDSQDSRLYNLFQTQRKTYVSPRSVCSHIPNRRDVSTCAHDNWTRLGNIFRYINVTEDLVSRIVYFVDKCLGARIHVWVSHIINLANVPKSEKRNSGARWVCATRYV